MSNLLRRAPFLLLAAMACGVASFSAAPRAFAQDAGGSGQAANADAGAQRRQELALIGSVMNLIRDGYVKPVDERKLVDAALKGMLEGLDPHSDYMTAGEWRDMMSATQGEFGGLGIEVTMAHHALKVVSPIDGTPAARAGVRAGDYIVKIEGKASETMSLRQAVDLMRGAPGSRITITLARKGRKSFDVSLVRAVIQIPSVKGALAAGGIGYIRISSFAANTDAEMRKTLASVEKKAGGRLNGVVLDLRNNPGGLLDAAVAVSGDLLGGGKVVSLRGRTPKSEHEYDAPKEPDILHGAPVAVLINGASASASEIVAGALQDRHRATIYGTRSFGKGSVQTILPLDGNGAVRMTTARYYTPSGRSIQDQGIVPDVVLSAPKAQQAGTALHEADFSDALKNTGSLDAKGASAAGARDDSADNDEAPIDPTIIGTAKDVQLQAVEARLLATIADGAAASAEQP